MVDLVGTGESSRQKVSMALLSAFGALALGLALTALPANVPVAQAAEATNSTRLRDPMQPPAVINPEAAATAGNTATDGAEAGTAEGAGVLQLASIRQAANGTARAQINGQWLAVGTKIGDWRVRTITTDSVLLQSTQDRRDTKLLMLHQLSIRRLSGTP